MRVNILATLAYFDIFDFPLKEEEVFRYLIKKSADSEGISADGSAIKSELEGMVKRGEVGEREGYFFIGDREYLVPLRIKKRKISEKKWKRAKRAVSILRHIPYIRAVFVSGSLAMNNCDYYSDIDIMIITAVRRIWLARFFESVLLILFRLRRTYKYKTAPDKICPNHYLTENNLSIPLEGTYNAMTYASLVPIIGESDLVEKFRKSNGWVLRYLYNWPVIGSNAYKERSFISRAAEQVIEILGGDYWEKILKKYQLARIENHRKLDVGGHIICDDNQLAFHPYSMEDDINKVLEKILNLEIN